MSRGPRNPKELPVLAQNAKSLISIGKRKMCADSDDKSVPSLHKKHEGLGNCYKVLSLSERCTGKSLKSSSPPFFPKETYKIVLT